MSEECERKTQSVMTHYQPHPTEGLALLLTAYRLGLVRQCRIRVYVVGEKNSSKHCVLFPAQIIKYGNTCFWMFQLNDMDPRTALDKSIFSLFSSYDNLDSFRVFTTVIWIYYANLHTLAHQYFLLHVSVGSFREKQYCISISILERINSLPPCPFPLKILRVIPLGSFFFSSHFHQKQPGDICFSRWNPFPSPIIKLTLSLASPFPPAHLQWPSLHGRRELGFCSALQLWSSTLL